MVRKNTKIWLPSNILVILCFINIFQQNVLCNVCSSKDTCAKCIAEHPRCAWCSEIEFSGIQRCDTMRNLKDKNCSRKNIITPVKSIQIITDKNLSDKGAREGEAIQVKPQEIKIRLTPNSVQKFKVEFRHALNYPVDLYYLIDLSRTMIDDKAKLSELGNTLADEMESITKNFKLGFGSFVDKTVEPYVDTTEKGMREPHPGSAPPYSFQNNMPLSSATHEFARRIHQIPISGNRDGPEGGFDAIMQAIVCKEEIGWRNKSRKLLVFSTDSYYHYAGDGKMGGIIAPNDEKCHLNAQGNYTASNQMDYPSLGQLKKQIRDHKVHIIFAVIDYYVKVYEALSRRLTMSSVGQLDKDSANIVHLIKEQYDKITSDIKLTDDLIDSNIELSYFSKCLGKERKSTNICHGVKVGTKVTFEVNMKYTFCPANPADRKRSFNIYPLGLQDALTVHLEMICECNCGIVENNSERCSGGGTLECGICICDEQRIGKQCECNANDVDPFKADKTCFYKENDTIPCSGQGVCKCGRCHCFNRKNPNEKIDGEYCECVNSKCDKKDGEICSGSDHGICECGTCKCLKGWTGSDCGCRDFNNTCIGPNDKVCSGHGSCVCGECKCETEEKGYFGVYCDDCSICPGMCNELKMCVECFMQKGHFHNCSTCSKVTEISSTDSIVVKEQEKQCVFEDENFCQFSFKYKFNAERQLLLWVQTIKECAEPVDIVSIVAGVIGGIVATGLFLLALWKILTHVHDKRELARFEKEIKAAKWQQGTNPLYKEVETIYQNPAYRGCRKSVAYVNPLPVEES